MVDWCEARSRRGISVSEVLGLAFVLAIIVGLVTTCLFGSRKLPRRAAGVDIMTFAMGLAAYHRDFGAYPPDDMTAIGGSAEDGANEVIFCYLGRKHRVGESFYGPYVTFKPRQLTDEDSDGFQEYRDPWGGVYVYAQRTPAPGEKPPRFFDIASPGPDGGLGGRMVPGKGYVPATSPAGKAAEADNVTNWR
ncbi:MAG: hypothetical protein ACYS9X_30110 [Planctomycetota bacterium]